MQRPTWHASAVRSLGKKELHQARLKAQMKPSKPFKLSFHIGRVTIPRIKYPKRNERYSREFQGLFGPYDHRSRSVSAGLRTDLGGNEFLFFPLLQKDRSLGGLETLVLIVLFSGKPGIEPWPSYNPASLPSHNAGLRAKGCLKHDFYGVSELEGCSEI